MHTWHTTSWGSKVWFLIQELNREWKFLIWSRNSIRNIPPLYRKSQDDDTPKYSLICFFYNLKMGLGHVTIIFDIVLRRLLISSTETNRTALSIRSLRTRWAQNYWANRGPNSHKSTLDSQHFSEMHFSFSQIGHRWIGNLRSWAARQTS